MNDLTVGSKPIPYNSRKIPERAIAAVTVLIEPSCIRTLQQENTSRA
jgi:hypothetical protein